MGGKKNRPAIDITVIFVQKVQDIWKNWQIARTLLIDVKSVFIHASLAKQA